MTVPLWRVGSGAGAVRVYGEVAGVHDRSWCTEEVLAALPRAGSLWRETPDAEVVGDSPLMAVHGLARRPLSEVVPPDVHARLAATCARLGGDVRGLEGLRPWLAGQLVEAMHLQHLGVDPQDAPGAVLAGLARERGLREAFELPGDAALQLLGGLPEHVEVAFLVWMLDRADEGREAVDRRVTASLGGDLGPAEADVAALEARHPAVHDAVVARRNRVWVDVLAGLVAREEDALAVVGLGHLAGPDGVLAGLRRRGVPVTGPGGA
jgi:uncharacterized protein YbaP (TraB family)